nr:fatty acid desaturase [Bacteriovorax sp. HI3]
MKTSWSKFRKDKYYLIKYFSVQFIVTAIILYIQYQLTDIKALSNLPMNPWHLALLPIGLIIGVQVPVLMHNCVHRNLRPPLLNTIMGEIAGVYILLGLAAFELNHTMHHAHADTDMDPHNPHKKNFFKFLLANNFGGTEVVLAKYLKYHGDTRTNHALFKLICFMHFLAVPMRLAFWFMLLGPSLFVLFFIPSYAFHMFVFAHINYITHETMDDGDVKIYNMDNNLYYRLVNFFGSGVYYHKNHHHNPGHYNPKNGSSQSWLFR